MSRLLNIISSIQNLASSFSRGEKRMTSSEFESAVNQTLLADTVSDNTRAVFVSEESSLAISAVWACVRILSETVGTLPIHPYRRTSNGRERAKGHPCSLLLQKPNSYLTRFSLMHHLMICCTLWGNGYARIYRDKYFRPVRLRLLHPTEIEPILTYDDELFYRDKTGLFIPCYDIILFVNTHA